MKRPALGQNSIPVSIVIPVRNEEKNLPNCLASVAEFADVHVVDSQSTDRTISICEEHGVSYSDFKWDGLYPKKRNWFLKNVDTAYDWVLFLDADEILTPAFKKALPNALIQDYVGYWLNYSLYFSGRELKYGVTPRKLALFRRSAGAYEELEHCDSSSIDLDIEIHEQPVLQGDVGTIDPTIDHIDQNTLGKYLRKHVSYAEWEAEVVKAKISEDSFASRRQKLKYLNIRRWWFAPAYFGYQYVFKLGFLDGRAGFSYAFYKFWYFYTIRTLIRTAT